MVMLGHECGVNVRAILTNMSTPLGRAAGNWLEVKESIECLEGKGTDDLMELVVDCAAHLLVQTNRATSLEEGRTRSLHCLASGAPRQKWDEMLVAQGADMDELAKKLKQLTTAPAVLELRATETKTVRSCDARIVGEIVRDLGGGRMTKESRINHEVGIDSLAKERETVSAGDVFARVHAASREAAEAVRARLCSAFVFGDGPDLKSLLVEEVIH
jgi:thymidine phosphorylase